MSHYALGVDFGTESGRTVLVDVRTGAELASHVHDRGTCEWKTEKGKQ